MIPLSSFAQQGWDANKLVPFTGRDIKAVIWSPVGEPLDSVNLAVDKAAFTNSVIISGTTRLTNTTSPGPYSVTTRITDDIRIQSASLLYSTNGGATFVCVPLTSADDLFSGAIPGQPLGTEVQYYIEAIDEEGNIATDPPDSLWGAFRFQVNQRPHLLVDDFANTNPANILGGNSFLFGRDSGGSIVAYFEGQALRLTYDVSATNSYAGYSTLLRKANLMPYNAMTFSIKGQSGGERVKIGLRDGTGNEPKLILSQYLPGEVTTAWQKVTIPLRALTAVANWTSIESVVVALENKIGSGKGTIYLDDLKFETTPYFIPIVVDNFNDPVRENGIGGSLWTASGGSATVTTGYDSFNRLGNSGAGLAITYQGVTSTAWATWGTDLLGLDTSPARYLSFDIKGARGGERPNIYLASRNNGVEVRKYVELRNYLTIATTWQRVDIPLRDFATRGIDLAHLSYIQVVFEWTDMASAVYLDNLRIRDIADIPAAQFYDVTAAHPFFSHISKLAVRGITSGCGGGNFCPDAPVTREQMAAFVIRALGDTNPPTPAQQRFTDVPPSNTFYNFIEQMALRQITLGCAASPPLYCPTNAVTREQMAAFIIRALHTPGYVPSTPALQRFADVPPANLFYAFIDEMAVRGITLGCGGSNYCPKDTVTRGQMAAFLARAFGW